MQTPAITRALREIASAAATAPEWHGVTVEQAIEHIDDDVLTEWIVREGGYTAVLHQIADQLDGELSHEKTCSREFALIGALVRNLPVLTTNTLHAALVKSCAADLAEEAFSAADALAAEVAAERRQARSWNGFAGARS